MNKVVVVGATGFLGRAFVREALTRAVELVVLVRNVDAARRLFAEPVRVLGWSLEAGATRAAWEAEVRGAAVVNLAGAGVMDEAWTDARKQELRDSRIEVTRALALALAETAPDARAGSVLVSASAIGIYGGRVDDVLMTEGSPHATDFLAKLCVDWEAAAEPARAAGIRVAHPRFGIVLGREGGALAELVRPFRLHVGGPIGSGKQWISWVHERDARRALDLALTSPSMSGPYNVVAPNPVTMDAMADAIATALHTHARLRAPGLALKAILGSGRAETILTGQRVSAARLLDAGLAFEHPDLLPALEDLLG